MFLKIQEIRCFMYTKYFIEFEIETNFYIFQFKHL